MWGRLSSWAPVGNRRWHFIGATTAAIGLNDQVEADISRQRHHRVTGSPLR
jgi:hypothetical protein